MRRKGLIAALLSLSMVLGSITGNITTVMAKSVEGVAQEVEDAGEPDVSSDRVIETVSFASAGLEDPLADKEAIESDTGFVAGNVEVRYADWGKANETPIGKAGSASVKHQVVFVLDSSGSMSGTPMRGLKSACRSFISDFFKNDPNTQIAIIDYGNQVTIHRFSGEIFTSDPDELNNAIDSLDAIGGTPMNEGLFKADEILSGSTAEKKYIIQMADGSPNVGT